jgi:ribosome-associated toxin RatA of RatAB toxin-antitoxin module
MVNGETKTWTSRRTLDPGQRRITFEQERSQAPIAAMGGEWTFRALPGGKTEILLEHSFAAVGDDPATVDWITTAVDRNSREELAALGRLGELTAAIDDVVFAFEDTVSIAGSPTSAYRFIYNAHRWPDRLPHVSRVVLSEPQPGVQDMEMDTVTTAGHTHTTKSVRICFPEERIVYKQLVPPALLFGHSGEWSFTAGPDGDPEVTARHTVAIDPTKVEVVLGVGKTLADAGTYLREALGANSRATVTAAGQHAGSAPARTQAGSES